MNKVPAKQIYLLMVIITGIIALSVYSTYAIFTFEGETSDAFNIQLPSVLKIQTDMYEYKQLEVEKNSVQTTDVDLYNTYDHELCYSIWYKVLGNNASAINIYELSDTSLSTNGTIAATTNSRFTLLITNDSDKNIKVNIGLAAVEATETCSLKLSSDKKNIKKIYDKPVISLSKHLLTDIKMPINDETAGSLIYKNKTVDILHTEKIEIASEYMIKEKKYQLVSSTEILPEEYPNKLNNLDYIEKNYYICSNKNCDTIYRINEATVTANTNVETGVITYNYRITNVDEYEAYNKGESGLKKIDKNYYYYGDNPHNFIYYNCQDDDISSCELWRIIGLIYDDTTDTYKLKIIRNDSIGNYQYHNNIDSNEWEKSKLYKYFSEEYQKNLKNISQYPHIYEEISDLNIDTTEILSTKINSKATKVTLINLTDYLNTSTCKPGVINTYTDCLNNNWLNRPHIIQEWILTSFKEPVNEEITIENNTETQEQLENNQPSEDEFVDNQEVAPTPEVNEEGQNEIIVPEKEPEIVKKQMYTVGKEIIKEIVTEKNAVRPVVYLQERMLYYSGDGTINNPYIIK